VEFCWAVDGSPCRASCLAVAVWPVAFVLLIGIAPPAPGHPSLTTAGERLLKMIWMGTLFLGAMGVTWMSSRQIRQGIWPMRVLGGAAEHPSGPRGSSRDASVVRPRRDARDEF